MGSGWCRRDDARHRVWLGMRCDSHDSQHKNSAFAFETIRPVVEEDAIRGGRLVLDVGLKDFFSAEPVKGPKLVRLQGRMARIGLQQSESFSDLFEKILLLGAPLELAEGIQSRRGQPQLAVHSSSAYCAKEPTGTAFPSAASCSPRRTAEIASGLR